MKKFFPKGLLPLLLAWLCACPAPPPGPVPATADEDRDRGGYAEERRRRDEERNRERERERERYRQKSANSPACEGDDDCEDICGKIYRVKDAREDCLELSIDEVETLMDVYEALEKPRDDKLEHIDSAEFDIFVDTDDEARTLAKLMKSLSGSETESILSWIIQDSDVAAIFKGADDEYKILKDLLANMDKSATEALAENIQDGQSFIELAIETSDYDAMDWIFGFIEEECEGKSYGEELCALQDWYCKVGLKDDSWVDFLSYGAFDELMGDILDDYTTAITANAPDSAGAGARATGKPADWWIEDMDADDLDASEDHFNDLCKWRHDRADGDLSANTPKLIKKR